MLDHIQDCSDYSTVELQLLCCLLEQLLVSITTPWTDRVGENFGQLQMELSGSSGIAVEISRAGND